MKKFISIAAIAVLFWMSCKDKIEKVEPPLCTVRGMVIDTLTRAPIENAWIDRDSFPPYRTYADTLGNYSLSFTEWPGKQRFLLCGKDGYITKKEYYISKDPPNTAIVNFELVPEGK